MPTGEGATQSTECTHRHRSLHLHSHTLHTLPLSLSHQTAGCLRSRNQCLLDSLDWGPPLPRDSRVMIGPANTDEHRHVSTQEDTDSSCTNKPLQDTVDTFKSLACLLLWADISTCSRPTGLRGDPTRRKHSASRTGPTWGSQPPQSPECWRESKVTTRHNKSKKTHPSYRVDAYTPWA